MRHQHFVPGPAPGGVRPQGRTRELLLNQVPQDQALVVDDVIVGQPEGGHLPHGVHRQVPGGLGPEVDVVRGEPETLCITEQASTSATNPYGCTKLFIEEIL